VTSRDEFKELQQFFDTRDTPELGPGPRAGVRALATLQDQFNRSAGVAALCDSRRELVRALVLLWHDHFDAAHTIAQAVETPDGSYVHGILHRREPDYGNAKYWFRRVGEHAAFAAVADHARALPALQAEPALLQELVPEGRWAPMAFIDACEEAAPLPSTHARVQLLRSIQAAEFHVLLGYLGRAVETPEGSRPGRAPGGEGRRP
jgi:hypothetical protein